MKEEKEGIVKRPKGLMVFAVLQAIAFLSAIPSLFKHGQQFISYGMVVSGWAFTITTLVQIVVGTAIAVGIAKVERWAYPAFMGLSAYFASSLVGNVALVDRTVLIRAGFPERASMLRDYRVVMCVALALCVGMVAWLFLYRTHFRRAANQAL